MLLQALAQVQEPKRWDGGASFPCVPSRAEPTLRGVCLAARGPLPLPCKWEQEGTSDDETRQERTHPVVVKGVARVHYFPRLLAYLFSLPASFPLRNRTRYYLDCIASDDSFACIQAPTWHTYRIGTTYLLNRYSTHEQRTPSCPHPVLLRPLSSLPPAAHQRNQMRLRSSTTFRNSSHPVNIGKQPRYAAFSAAYLLVVRETWFQTFTERTPHHDL